MANFDWQTEDEKVWEARETGTPRVRRLLPFAVVLVVLVLGGLFLYRMAREQVESAEEAVRERVLSSYQLLRAADGQQDKELLLSLLSGHDPLWTDVQVALLEQGALLDRSAFGLSALPLVGDEGVEELSLSPDLEEALLELEQPYAIEVGNGLTETVHLRHELIFRLGANRWLYAPPEDQAAYWGERTRHDGGSLIVIYPHRDDALVRRLASDLEPLVAAGWVAAGIDEPPRPLTVRLATGAQSLLVLDQHNSLLQVAPQLTLPTPTLVGEPVDDAAYRALYRGYGVRLVAHVVVSGTGYTCCDHDIFYRTALRHYLADIGLVPAPPPPTIPATDPFVNATPSIDELERLSAVSGADTLRPAHRAAIAAFVSFLVAEGVDPLIILQAGALTPETLSLFFAETDRRGLEARWQLYVQNYILADAG